MPIARLLPLALAPLALAALSAACSAQNATAHTDPSSVDAASASADASDASTGPTAIPLVGCGVNYAAQVTVGTQPFSLVVDTGSTALLLGGSTCTDCTADAISPLYAPGPSATDTKKAAMGAFANGTSWNAEIYSDSVTLPGSAPVSVKLGKIEKEQTFFAAFNQWCGRNTAQGIIGLGTDLALPSGTSSYVDQLKASGSPDVFSFELCDTTGSLWLGGFDSRYSPTYEPLIPGRFYTVGVKSMSVGGADLGLSAATYGNAFADTGGDALWLGQAAFDAVIAALGKDAGFKGLFGDPASFFGSPSCTTLKQTSAELDAMLPKLTFTFASGAVVDSGATSSYLMNHQGCYLPALNTRGAGVTGLPPIELGAPWLHGKVVVVDRAQKRMGFAEGTCP